MPPKKARPRPVTWQVVGGGLSGGLIVRKGSETKSEEYAERLAKGALIQELEVQGERMKYRRVRGTGPEEGWISTKFKGKDQLKARKLKAWILATGTRGDIQPFLALALGMRDAGYEMTIWSCEDYKDFVEGYGIPMFRIARSVEERLQGFQGNAKQQKGSPGKAQDKAEKSVMQEAKVLMARAKFSLEHKGPVGGIDFEAPMSPEIMESFSKESVMFAYADRIGICNALQQYDAAERWEKLRSELEAEIEAEKAEKAAEGKEGASKEIWNEDSVTVPAITSKENELDREALEGLTEAPQIEEWWNAQRSKAGPGALKVMEVGEALMAESEHNVGEAVKAVCTFEEQRRYWEGTKFTDLISLMHARIDGLFMHDLRTDETILQEFAAQLKRDPPDLLLYNSFWVLLAHAVGAYLHVPSVFLCLQTSGLNLTDPSATWLTDEAYPYIQKMEPALLAYPTLKEAREKYVIPEEWWDLSGWAKYVQWESALVEPLLGVHPIRDMGPMAFSRAVSQRHVVGFLSSIASSRFLNMMGPQNQRSCAKHTYTGFWIMDEKYQIGSSSSSMFGGAELMKTVEDFIAAGGAPAYIGWGSCVCDHGREWMILLAVGALKKAGMRGIVLGGWAELSLELLTEVVGKGDPGGLVAYAKKNILFIKKAPQVWLFPKCSVVVIHGGVGTLAAAWTSGTPLIVCPVWLDQFTNSFLNTLMGAGVMTGPVDDCGVAELAYAMKVAVEDPAKRQGAQAVQFSMMMDKGIQTATEFIDDVVLKEFPSGRWDQWWL